MTTITQNLPWFIRDLGISVIGQECYTSLVENLNISDVKCIQYSLSKGLGVGIVVGASVMKVPQLLLIVNAGSARGLSLTAYILETLSYAITLLYSIRKEFPFSTYGENLFLTIQNVVITFLIILYAPSSSAKGTKLLTIAIATILSSIALYTIPSHALSLLQFSTLPLSLFSKLPQIRQNSRSQSTGQLSTVAVVAQIAGCAARLFTNATETGDNLVAAGFVLALLLNLVLGLQLWTYWGKGETDGKVKSHYDLHSEDRSTDIKLEEKSRAATPPRISASWQTSPSRRVATPPPRTSSASGTRKWSRKVD